MSAPALCSFSYVPSLPIYYFSLNTKALKIQNISWLVDPVSSTSAQKQSVINLRTLTDAGENDNFKFHNGRVPVCRKWVLIKV